MKKGFDSDAEPCSAGANPAGPLFESFHALARDLGRDLYRFTLYPDGRGEAEFTIPNPVEVLVLKWSDSRQLERILNGEMKPEAVIRKKCVKCLLHERPGQI